jgi:nucleoside-diphosphate-sugar epimerase
MKIIITGGSGFIGTNLIEKLKQSNFEVLNIDIKKPKKTDHIKYWEKADINDLNELEKIVLEFNPDYIVHLAARTDLDGVTLDDYSSNIGGVQNLMKVVNMMGNLRKIIITSSMLVCESGYVPKSHKDYKPDTIYGESKVLTEKSVWENSPKCDWAIIRPTSIWGPWFDIPYRNFFNLILAKKYFHVGNKGCTKTYGYVGNSVYQIERILMADTSDLSNKVFYIGDDPAYNIEEWANEIGNELKIKIKKMPFILIKFAAFFGDLLKKININFPMTSFRLKNMTTNNIKDLENTCKLAKKPPYTRKEGVKVTLNWLLGV